MFESRRVTVFCFILSSLIGLINVRCHETHDTSAEPDLWKSWSENPWDWDSFLEEQYYDTIRHFEQLGEDHLSRHRRDDDERITIHVDSVSADIISESALGRPLIFDVSSEKQILVEDNIFNLHKHDRGVMYLEFIHILDIVEPITFVESTEYKNETYVFLAHRHHAELFKLPQGSESNDAKSKWQKSKRLQKLSSEGNKLASAKFLQHNELLYLVVLYRRGKGGKVYSIIYQWTATYFDELYTMKTDGAVGLAIIKEPDYFILIITQNSANKIHQESLVYKLIPDVALQKLHSLRTFGARLVLVYRGPRPSRDPHALIINGMGHSDIYRMKEGGELVPASRKFDFKNIAIGTVAEVEGDTFIFLGTQDEVFMYRPIRDDLKELNKLKLVNKTILNIEYVNQENENHSLIIITKTGEGTIVLNILRFTIEKDVIVSAPESIPIFQCLSDIEDLLNNRQNEINDVAEKIRKTATIEGSVIEGILKVSKEVWLENSRVENINLTNEEHLNADISDVLESARVTEQAIKSAEEKSSRAFYKDEPLRFTNRVEIQGDLVIENLKASHLNVATINGNPFDSRSFISQSEVQYIPESLMEGKTVLVRNLTAPYFNKFLQNAPVFASLTAQSAFLASGKTVNGIDPGNLVTRGFEGTVMGTKTFDRLTALNLETDRLDKEKLTPWIERAINNETPTKNLRATSDVSLSNLIVKKVNGIDISEFMDTTFQRGIHSEFKGNLRFTSDLTVDNLRTESLQGKAVDRYLTRTTEQTISSNLTFRNILVTELDVNKVNGIDLAKDVAFIGRHNAIKTPTTIFNLDVTNDLLLNCGAGNQTFCNIVPTKPEDLLQMYNGPVTIQGSLAVPDLNFGKKAKLTVNGEEFHTEVQSLYWMKEKSQVIPQDVIFTKGVSVPQIEAQNINDLPVEKIFSPSSVRANGNISLHFKDVTIQRDINVIGEGNCTIIKEMDRSAVKKTGQFRVTGKKTFLDQLVVGNLKTELMNNVDMRDVVLKNSNNIKFTGVLRLEKVHITGDLQTLCDVTANIVNGVRWTDFVNNAVRVDLPTTLYSVTFHNSVYADTINVESGPFSTIASEMHKSFTDVDVSVLGPAVLGEVFNVQQINGINWRDYSNLIVKRSSPSEVRGHKTIRGQIKVNGDFNVRTINGFPLEMMMNDVLTKSSDQVITGRHIFGDVYADHLEFEAINGIDRHQFIDITEPEIFINTSVGFHYLTLEGDLGGVEVPCDLGEVAERLNNIPARRWNQVYVDGPVFWTEPRGRLSRIFDKAVLRGKEANIEAEVFFEAGLSTAEIESEVYLNDLNIHHVLLEDSLKKHSETTQVVTGRKVIKNNLLVEDAHIVDLQSRYVNGFDILLLNSTLVRSYGDDEIFGEKIITSPVNISTLKVPGMIHGVPTEDLATAGSDRPIKEAHFKSLTIEENLNVETVNGIPLKSILENSIKLRGQEQHVFGDVTFENVEIDDCRLSSINSMPVEDMIMDTEGDDIHIYGDKTFTRDVVVNGPVHVNKINGLDVAELHRESVYAADDAHIQGDLVFEAPVTVMGDISFRGMVNKIDPKLYMDNGYKLLDDSKLRTSQTIQQIHQNLDLVSNIVQGMSSEFLYADDWSRVELGLGNSRPAGIRYYAEKTFIDVHELHSGQDCGLPADCVCPRHHTIKISTDKSSSVTTDRIKYSRIFSLLSPPGFTTNLITTTTSVSKNCRIDPPTIPHIERSWISWRTRGQKNKGFFDLGNEVTGFVSDVKSFFSDGQYYSIISQFYDKEKDSHNLYTIVTVLDFNQRLSPTVQRIPSYGAWVLEVLQTNRGIYLIVGNTFDSWKRANAKTEVLRFNTLTYQFEHLQSVTTHNCRSITSAIVPDGPSFIILVQGDEAPLLVMKHDEEHDRFTAYQTFDYGAEVSAASVSYVGYNPVEPWLFIVTSKEDLIIYQFTYSEGWKVHSSGFFEGIQNVIPFSLGRSSYILATSNNSSTVLQLVTQGVE